MKPQQRTRRPAKGPCEQPPDAPNQNSKIEIQKSETVLLAATGMSPGVLTETVWALANEDPPVIPECVVAVTTISGRQAIERELLSPPNQQTPALWQELRLAILGPDAAKQERLILEPPRLVEAPNPRTGQTDWLEDMRTAAEHNATANFLLSELRRWTEIPDSRLIVSIAGGRKTMGALLYACVSLLGRETDRLTHVLVNDPFDDPRLRPKFYFPKQTQQQLQGTDGRQWRAAEASIDLADIPFVPFRNLFERHLVRKASSFVELVQRCRHKVEEIARKNTKLALWRSRREVQINATTLKTSNAQHTLLLFLAQRAADGHPPLAKYETAVEPLREFGQHLYDQREAEDFSDWRHDARLPKDFAGQELRKVLNELKTKLQQAGPGARALLPLLPEKGRFSLDLPAEAITFKD